MRRGSGIGRGDSMRIIGPLAKIVRIPNDKARAVAAVVKDAVTAPASSRNPLASDLQRRRQISGSWLPRREGWLRSRQRERTSGVAGPEKPPVGGGAS